MNLLYIADPMCAWCYGFGHTLDALLAQPGAAAPLQLALVMGGLRPHTRNALSAPQAQELLAHWAQVHEATGLPFKTSADAALLQPGFVYDTEPASRAVVAVRTHWPRLMWRYFKAIQHAFYAEGRDVTRADLLADLAVALGVPRADFALAFASDAARESTAADAQRVLGWGMRAFPALLAVHGEDLRLVGQGYANIESLHHRLAALAAQAH